MSCSNSVEYSGVVTSITRMYTKNELDWGRGIVSQELI